MEEWRPIEEASNYLISDSGRVQRRDTGRELSVHTHSGHPTVNLFVNGTYIKRRIDQLVAKAFGGTVIDKRPRGRPREQRWVIDRETGEHIPIN